jgi:uncharacterized protein
LAAAVHLTRRRAAKTYNLATLSVVAATLAACLWLAGCSPHAFFYYPNKNLYIEPHHLKLNYEMVRFPSANGKMIFGLLFRTEQKPKGIVVHFHGNFGNVSNHFIGATFMLDHGFDVFVFDYEGYGGSEGRPSPARTVADGIAALKLAAALDRNPQGGVVVLAQSLGGAAAIPAMARAPVARAAVIQSSFTNYRVIARDVLKRSWITWILYPIYPQLLWTRYEPVRWLDRLPPMPLMFIHGDRDGVIPLKMTKKLFDRAREPKQLWIVPGAGHNDLRQSAGEDYDRRVAEFFSSAVPAYQ